ncbi:MAG: DUF3438 family protein [Pseudomonadales bacterium]
MKRLIVLMMRTMACTWTLSSSADALLVNSSHTDLGSTNKQTLSERVLWDKRPIPLYIQSGHERIVHFPDDIRYWLPDSIKHKVTALAANGVLYLQAHDSFTTTRIRVQGLTNQQVYLLDVSAGDVGVDGSKTAKGASNSDTLIVMQVDAVANQAKQTAAVSAPTDWKIRLTRFAAQQLYAPERPFVDSLEGAGHG